MFMVTGHNQSPFNFISLNRSVHHLYVPVNNSLKIVSSFSLVNIHVCGSQSPLGVAKYEPKVKNWQDYKILLQTKHIV